MTGQGGVDAPPRRRRHTTNVDFVAFVRRILAAAGRRVAESDESDLRLLITIEVDLKRTIQAAVDGMRSRGIAWSQIGDAAGTSKQAAQARWGRRGGAAA